jgi:dienelactone hydrolase
MHDVHQEVFMNHNIIFLLIAILGMAAVSSAEIKTENVTYQSGGLTMKGYIAYNDAVKGKRPGILVVHEWWGQTENVRNRARMLAELGYTGMAVDMYGNGKTTMHPDEAGKFTEEVMKNVDDATKRFTAAIDVLKKHPTVDPERIGAMGYCFGGSVVLTMARQGLDLDGVVSFHGGLDLKTPAKAGAIKAKVLVCHGADDKFISAQQVEKFQKEMKDAGADMQFISYPGALHGFTNPDATELGKKNNIPIAYNADADKKSWEDMKAFWKKVFGQ